MRDQYKVLKEAYALVNESSYTINHQKLDEDRIYQILELQADLMWLPVDEMGRFSNQEQACESIYRFYKPELIISTEGLDPDSDGKEYFYRITDKNFLNRLSLYFKEDRIIQGLIQQGKVEYGIEVKSYNGEMNIYFYKVGAINNLDKTLHKLLRGI